MKLTTTTVRGLELPIGIRDKTYFDDDLPGFGVRIRDSGARVYVVAYKAGGRNKRLVLGPITMLDSGKARSTAKDILARIRLGQDPAAERQDQRDAAAITFDSLLPRYLAWQKARLKPGSYDGVQRHLTVHLKMLHRLPIVSIDRRLVAVRLAGIAEQRGPVAANRTRASLSTFFGWLLREGIVEANPATNTNCNAESPRTRVLSDDELTAIWKALGTDDYSDIVRLLMLTGARREEIGSLRFSEIDFVHAMLTLSPARTKSGREHQIPLSSAALKILRARPRIRDSVFGRAEGFQNWAACKRRLVAKLKITGWNLHDFRRSLSTTMHERLGVAPHIVEACLGHVGHQAGVAGIYNVSIYSDLKRIALQKWSDHVMALIGERRNTVVKLRQ
jgi:integrase